MNSESEVMGHLFNMSKKELWQNQPEFENTVEEESIEYKFLILHNDEVHSFEFVIESLIDVCKMDEIQAEQCTFLVHYKGKCDVKKGPLTLLKPYKEALNERGLEVTIE
jgi:ATP-dependent Clp protease adaptor protein ClpS